jgi:hypothetical protein
MNGTTVVIDLINEFAVNIGATYIISIQLCNAPDLTLYDGYSQIRTNNTSENIVLSPTITVISKDVFELRIPFNDFSGSVVPGLYQYDVLFSNAGNRFYAVGGKVQILKRITQLL